MSIIALNPLSQIRSSCEFVCHQSKHVTIDDEIVKSFSQTLKASTFNDKGTGDDVSWDSSGWHYNADTQSFGPLTCQYIVVMDALNFCFWSTEGLEYDYLATSLKKVLEEDSTAFAAEKLAVMDENKLQSWFPAFKLPQLSERVLRLQELGGALLEDFEGLAANMVRAAQGSACRLVTLVLRHIPGFRDTSIYKGHLIHFYKRAQILTGDVWAAYGKQVHSQEPGQEPAISAFSFFDVHMLTMFADYRVPQLLRQVGVLKYSEALSASIDQYHEIPVGSEEEVEIRAGTVIAVERIQAALAEVDVKVMALEVDWLLWQQGENTRHEILPHHRTMTIYY